MATAAATDTARMATGVQSVAWSPDDRRFVLTASAKPNAPFDVYTVDADGRHLTRLTWNLNASSATWRK